MGMIDYLVTSQIIIKNKILGCVEIALLIFCSEINYAVLESKYAKKSKQDKIKRLLSLCTNLYILHCNFKKFSNWYPIK